MVGPDTTPRANPQFLRSSRRELLRLVLTSPLLAAMKGLWAPEPLVARALAGESTLAEEQELIAAATDAINVFDFEAVAKEKLPAAHYDYLSLGVEREITLQANRDGFAKFQLRARRLVDVSDLQTEATILGDRMSSPIVLAPVRSQRAFHPEGELAVARAAKRHDHLQILSLGTSIPVEEVSEARGKPVWFQLYTPSLWPVTGRRLKRAEQAGCQTVVLTVDHVGAAGRDRIRSYRREENPECRDCHDDSGLRNIVGEVLSRFKVLDWDYVDRIRDATSMNLVLKGILTAEDAAVCVDHGVDGVIVSNHGGRVVDTGLSTIEVLPEVATAIDGRLPILIDSGFRRGSDFFKALALGASAVCIGRPYIWGLAAFGQEGVEAVLTMLRRELEDNMRQMGTPSIAGITRTSVHNP
jgi:4-hydroxymandelate oxidase